MGPGPLIAIYVVLLYSILGPLVLFGIYVLFDSLDRLAGRRPGAKEELGKDPALWGPDEVERFVGQQGFPWQNF